MAVIGALSRHVAPDGKDETREGWRGYDIIEPRAPDPNLADRPRGPAHKIIGEDDVCRQHVQPVGAGIRNLPPFVRAPYCEKRRLANVQQSRGAKRPRAGGVSVNSAERASDR